MRVIPTVLLLLLMNLQINQPLPTPIIVPIVEKVVVSDTISITYINNMKRNNPFNIRTNSSNNWVGKIPNNTEPFEKFSTLEYGLRAGFKLLQNYDRLYNINTVKGIIHKFAPPFENNTVGYISTVCSRTGFGPNQILDLYDKDIMVKLARQIIIVETGTKLPYSLLGEVYDKYFTCT